MTDTPSPTTASDICTRCGICCGGALFNYGELEDSETDRVERSGVRVKRVNGQARFLLPCSRFLDNRCTVYDVRPAICRSYRCQLLKDFENGEISAEQAHARVDEAQSLVKRVRELLPAGKDLASARDDWERDHAAGKTAASPLPNPQLTLGLFMLNRILDRYFRKTHQRMMSAWAVDEPRSD